MGTIMLNNRYKFMRKIGEGAFSEVYSAFDKTSNDYVAVKVLLD